MNESENEIFIIPQEIDYNKLAEGDIVIDLLSKSNLSFADFSFLIAQNENINLKIIKLFQEIAKMSDVDRDSLLHNLQNNSFRQTVLKDLFSDSTIDKNEIILASEVLKNIINSIRNNKGWDKRILQIDLNKLIKEDRKRREKINRRLPSRKTTEIQRNRQAGSLKKPKRSKEQPEKPSLKSIVYEKLGGWENVRNTVEGEINREINNYENNEEYVFRSIITNDFINTFIRKFLREHDNLTNKEWGQAKALIKWHFDEVKKLRGY